MALISKASLLMVPSTYEEGTLYNVLPSGNRAPDSTDQNCGYDQTRADFTFDRGTDHGATRIGSDGLIKKYRENLLLQSNQFDTWSITSGSSVASGQSGYDGSSDAWLLNDSGNNSAYCIYRGYTNTGVQTFSIYAKQASTSQLEFDFLGGSGGYLRVELTDGSLHSTINTIDYNIEDAGNGWWRCSFATNHTSAPILVRIGCNGTGSIYIQNAQVESSMVATDVLTSGATTGKAGVLIDLPRINYDANGENGSLLLEPSRQQLIQYSEYFGGYTTTETNVTTNTGTSPEGVQNASSVIETTASSNKRILPSSPFLGTGGANYTLSVYVKKIAGQPTRHIYWMCQLGADAIYAHFDMDDFSVHEQNDNGTGSVTNADIIPVGNDWYRLILSGSISTTGGDYYNQLYFEDTPRTGFFTQSYTGNGTSGFEIYGWQAEAGSYATSYIPNHSGTGGVTRAADSCSVTGVSDVIGQTEGTLFFECTNKALLSFARYFGISDGTTANRIDIYHHTSDRLAIYVATSNTAQVNVQNVNLPSSGSFKFALAYANNDYVWYLNGSEIGTDTSASVPLCDTANIGTESLGTAAGGNSPFKQTTLFDTRLTNSELATLTTL